VKEHVKSMLTVINESKANQIKERVREETYNHPVASRSSEIVACRRPPGCGSELMSGALEMRFADDAASLQRMARTRNPARKLMVQPCAAPVLTAPVDFTLQCMDSSFSCELAVDRESVITAARVEKGGSDTSGSNNMRNDSSNEKQKGNIESSDNGSSSSTSASAYAGSGASVDGREVIDFTKYAGLLDRKYEELDPDSALRPTIINPSDQWTKKSTKSLMSEPTTALLTATELNDAKQATFELLDALTRSGALVMESASLHVVIAATHCFDKSLMDTVVQGNVNPIERVERSAVIMATTIHRLPASALLSDMEVQRVLSCSPQLRQLEY
jgi:hypothetical protein